MSLQKIIAVVGPTSSGKSTLGILMAQKLNGEIISADSRQVYKGLNIGTGKVTKKEMRGVPHHLLDVANPKKQFSADDFVRFGTKAITTIYRSKKVPIIVGGTGLYVDALLGRVTFPHISPNPKLRATLEKLTVNELFEQLKKLDPERAKTIEAKNPRRLIRAIEIAVFRARSAHFKGERRPDTKCQGEPEKCAQERFDVLWLGLNPKDLQKRIRARLFARLKVGMVREAKNLHESGFSYKRMHELGLEYRYLSLLLQKKISPKQFEKELERAINQYAKRQMRWFKRNKEIYWIQNKAEALRLAKAFTSR